MPNIHKINFLKELENRFGKLKKLQNSQSLFDLDNVVARIYVRYSKVHPRNRSFYGLREEDLKQLEGLNSFLCFVWDTQNEPLFIPYAEFENIFREVSPANDGQFKLLICHQLEQTELYIANAGRFNVENFFGWEFLESRIDSSKIENIPEFTHSQIQTLIGSIGVSKGFDIWIPTIDRNKLDWNLANSYICLNA